MGSVLSLFASRHSLTTSISRKSLTTMSQERVKSKNLFNFRSQGFIDPEVVLYDEKMKKEMGLDPVAMEEQMLSQTETKPGGWQSKSIWSRTELVISPEELKLT